jgi:effector-binding domain-containing protein
VTSEIPGGSHAVALHVGSYDTLSQTYDALYQWVHENGHNDAGPPFESYIVDPQGKPESEWRTEVLVPIG